LIFEVEKGFWSSRPLPHRTTVGETRPAENFEVSLFVPTPHSKPSPEFRDVSLRNYRLPALLDITISAKLEAKSFTISVYRIYTHKIYGSGVSHRYNAKLVISRIVIARVYLIANSLAYDQKVVLILAKAMLPCGAPGLYSFRGSRGRIRCSEIAHNRCAHSIPFTGDTSR
jgi:hypothetical protein